MPQIFHPSTNTISKVSIFGGVFMVAGLGWIFSVIYRSPYRTWVHVAVEQPVQFSHKHHVSGLGLDCRYCHESVEISAVAGMPSTETCMTCHSQIWTEAPELEPVRESFKSGRSISWNRVHDLPDYVQFNHSIHVSKGVGCVSCHGRVDQMPLMWRENTLYMEWCLDCHRHPEKFLRPREQVFDLARPGPESATVAAALQATYGVESKTSCSTCHY